MARWRDMPSAGRRVQQLTDNRLLVGECVTKVGKAILAAIVLTDWGTVHGCRRPRGSAGQPFVVYADTGRSRRNRSRALKVMKVPLILEISQFTCKLSTCQLRAGSSP